MAKKLYYKIGEACKILDIQPYVLRYWEKEFPLLSPNKSKSGQRVYNERELGIIRRIKELLYDEGYTIAGAKKKLETELAEVAAAGNGDPPVGAGETPNAESGDGQSEAPSSPEGGSDAGEETAAALRKMRSGVGEALAQARRILKRLESTSP